MTVHKAVLLQFLLILSIIKLSDAISCPEIEKHSLLIFKQSLKDPSNQLSSWDGGEVDCCKWKGVVCNNVTGHVTNLHLQGKNDGHGLSGKINPSLLNLKFLTHLDLSRNEFAGETIPSFIGSFTKLKHLDLSYADFGGKIPQNIGNLSDLHYLNLESFAYSNLEADNLDWSWGFQKLEYLNMYGVIMSRASNWAKVINSLPSLLELNFSSCNLDLMSPMNDVNLSTSLKHIDLSYNNYDQSSSPPVPGWVFQLSNLLSLDLSECYFLGPFPVVFNATKLQYIDLSSNRFNSSIPDWLYFCRDLEFLDLNYNVLLQGEISHSIGNLTSLQFLDLSQNQLSGKLPREITNLCRIQSIDFFGNELHGEVQDSFGNMSDCFLGSLEELTLRVNQLSGHLVDQFGEFKILKTLDLSFNKLSGEILTSLGNLMSLKELSLNDNNITGSLPESLGQLSNLEVVRVGNNKLEGIVTENHFTTLSNLTTFSASGNRLTLNVGTNWTPPFQLFELGLGSWRIDSELPLWLQTQGKLWSLDLSNTGINGSIPTWIFGICSLNLSHNHLYGKIPPSINCCNLDLSSNKLTGSLPQMGNDTVIQLDLSHNSFTHGLSDALCYSTSETYQLEVLHLEGNQLNGEIPDCWERWSSLLVLKLGNNKFFGTIPSSIGFLTSLVSLSLYDNKFSGNIPSAMRNCTSLWKIDLSRNNLDGNIPAWMGNSLIELKYLTLHSNKLSGDISSEICHLQSLQILDLSNNQFSGIIPRCASNLSAMATQRSLESKYYIGSIRPYSKPFVESATVVTKGVELGYSTILSLVTNIDLSSNNLSGDIPKELTSLVQLQSLNLSGNQLTGSIPASIGDMNQLESLDFSSNSLSGQIPNGFKSLSYLSYLNLSFNKLTGRIPESTQLQGFDSSSFMGNNLCGPPLTSNCSSDSDGGGQVPVGKNVKGEDRSEIEWLYILLSLGYAVGFSGICSVLVLKKSWRDAYFGWVEGMWNKFYVYCCIKWGWGRDRLTKAAAPTS